MQPHIVLSPSTVTGATFSQTATALPVPDTDVVGGILMIETSDARMQFDGTSPTSGVGGGLLMKKDSVWEITGRDFFVKMRFVKESTDGYVTVAYTKGE